MKKVKTRADKDKYGELVFGTDNIPSDQYMKPLLEAWEREYSKAFNVFRLSKEDLNREFTTIDGDRLKLLGQLEQKIMLVQHVETGRYYRLPTKEVVQGMDLTYGERYLNGKNYSRNEQSLLESDI
jgi:hypothetical protein